jgi:phosphatidylserine/phosphatidylglycerophosphate/cardiolipin synthase-like enzyme
MSRRSSVLLALASFTLAACSSSHTDDTSSGQDSGAQDSGALHADASTADAGADAAPAATYTLITEPDQGMQPIYDFVTSAKKTIDMTMYGLSDTTMTGLLTTAASKGIAVRVILDQNLEMMDNAAAYAALGAGGVKVHWANPTYASTHQKTITVDGATSAIMSLNLTSIDYPTSRDFAVITDDKADVAAIESVFAADFVNAAITPPNGDNLVWSPTNAESSLVGIIDGAKTSLLVENEEMSDSSIVTALEHAAGRGVAVHIAMEDSSSYQTEFAELVTAGAKLSTYAHDAIYIHAKVVLADYGTTAASVFVGSENFTYTSLNENRELGLITADPGIMAGINTTLTKDFTGGTPFQVPSTPPPGTDGGAEAGAAEGGVAEGGAVTDGGGSGD